MKLPLLVVSIWISLPLSLFATSYFWFMFEETFGICYWLSGFKGMKWVKKMPELFRHFLLNRRRLNLYVIAVIACDLFLLLFAPLLLALAVIFLSLLVPTVCLVSEWIH